MFLFVCNLVGMALNLYLAVQNQSVFHGVLAGACAIGAVMSLQEDE